jgi:hypothetical protein
MSQQLPPQSPIVPPLPPLQVNPQPIILTIVEHAVVMYSGRKWKVVNMDPNGPQKNIAWKIPRSNNWLARINSVQGNAELLNIVGPVRGNAIRGFVNNWDTDVTISIVACKIRANEQGQVEYVPGGIKPEREEHFMPWLGSVTGFETIDMSPPVDVIDESG